MRHKYMTTGDAARLVRVSNQAIDAAVRKGRLTVAIRTVGGVRLFRHCDVERFCLNLSKKKSRKRQAEKAVNKMDKPYH